MSQPFSQTEADFITARVEDWHGAQHVPAVPWRGHGCKSCYPRSSAQAKKAACSGERAGCKEVAQLVTPKPSAMRPMTTEYRENNLSL